jgi:hypothetical protein
MADVRTPQNRLKNHTGTVHWAENGNPACGRLATHGSWLRQSVATVTCKNCIALYGEDDPGHVDPVTPYYADEHAQRRAIERDARRKS